MTTPALPPGFVLEQSDTPPLPPGFQLESSTPSPAPQEAAPNPTDGMTTADRFWAGMGKSFADAGRGLKQTGTSMAEYFLAQNPAIGGIGGPDNSLLGRVRDSAAEQESAITESRALDAPLMDTGAGLTGNVAGYATQMLTPAAALRGTSVARALLPTTLRGNVAQGAVLGAVQPVAAGESRVANAGLASLAGAGGHALARGTGALASRARDAIAPEARKVFEAAKARGISLSPAQLSDSRVMQRVQLMLRNLPFTGAQGRYDDQVAAFNRELAKEIGVDAPVVTPEVFASKKAADSRKFEELSSRNALKVNEKLVRTLAQIEKDAAVAGGDVLSTTRAVINDLLERSRTGQDGVTIPGQAYQAFDSQLGQIAMKGTPTSHFVGRVKSVVRDAMDASISPQDKAAWQQLRREYGNRKTIRDLVAKADGGPISPGSLKGRVTANNAGKESMATGKRGGLGELAIIGQRLKEPSSSGTAENMLAGGLLNPINWPFYALGGSVGATAGRAVDSSALASLMMRQNPGMTREVAGRAANRLVLPAGASYGNQRDLTLDISGGQIGPPISEDEIRRLRGR